MQKPTTHGSPLGALICSTGHFAFMIYVQFITANDHSGLMEIKMIRII